MPDAMPDTTTSGPYLFPELGLGEVEHATLVAKRAPIDCQRELYEMLRMLGFDKWVEGCMAAGKAILHHKTALCIDAKDGRQVTLLLQLEVDGADDDDEADACDPLNFPE